MPVATGGQQFGDYFFVAFEDQLEFGEELSGAYTATWDTPAFDISEISELDVYWGSVDSNSVTTGTLLTTVAVPEPNAWPLLCLIAPALVAWRRKCRACHASRI